MPNERSNLADAPPRTAADPLDDRAPSADGASPQAVGDDLLAALDELLRRAPSTAPSRRASTSSTLAQGAFGPGALSRSRTRRTRARRLRALATLAMLSVVALATLAMVGLGARLRDTPRWWRSADASDPATVALAQRVERAVLEHVRRPRPIGEPWTVSVTVEQANAWLAARLPLWAAHRGAPLPEAVEQVQADFSNNRVALGASLNIEGARQIVAATFMPSVREDGSLWLLQPRTLAGRLDLPRDWTMARLRQWLPPRFKTHPVAARTLAAITGEAPLIDDASVSLEGDVRVRLLGVRAQQGQLELLCVNERKRQTATTASAP